VFNWPLKSTHISLPATKSDVQNPTDPSDAANIKSVEGCLTGHLPHEIKRNANLMQIGNFIDVFLARHVSGTYAHHQEH